MAPESGQAASEDEESLLRPAWEETADETDADRGLRPGPSRARSLGRTGGAEDLPSLLGPLCSAADALARLDARAAAAAGPVRDGLIARMAYLEAAGFLAHTHAWAHPLDLALRERGLTASTALAAVRRPASRPAANLRRDRQHCALGGSAARRAPRRRCRDCRGPHAGQGAPAIGRQGRRHRRCQRGHKIPSHPCRLIRTLGAIVFTAHFGNATHAGAAQSRCLLRYVRHNGSRNARRHPVTRAACPGES